MTSATVVSMPTAATIAAVKVWRYESEMPGPLRHRPFELIGERRMEFLRAVVRGECPVRAFVNAHRRH